MLEIAGIFLQRSIVEKGRRVFIDRGMLLKNGNKAELLPSGIEIPLLWTPQIKSKKEHAVDLETEDEPMVLVINSFDELTLIRPYSHLLPRPDSIIDTKETEMLCRSFESLATKEGILIVASERFSGKTIVTLSILEKIAETHKLPILIVTERKLFHSNYFEYLSPRIFSRTVLDDVGICVVDLNDVKTSVEAATEAAQNGWSVFMTIAASNAIEAMRSYLHAGGNEDLVEELIIVGESCNAERTAFEIKERVELPRFHKLLKEKMEMPCRGRIIPLSIVEGNR